LGVGYMHDPERVCAKELAEVIEDNPTNTVG
jgi:hypothetical protein